jgi:hypothetical protein
MAEPFERLVLSERWSATITVKMKRSEKVANGRGYFDNPVELADYELVDLEVSAPSLEALRHKLISHINLIEED